MIAKLLKISVIAFLVSSGLIWAQEMRTSPFGIGGRVYAVFPRENGTYLNAGYAVEAGIAAKPKEYSFRIIMSLGGTHFSTDADTFAEYKIRKGILVSDYRHYQQYDYFYGTLGADAMFFRQHKLSLLMGGGVNAGVLHKRYTTTIRPLLFTPPNDRRIFTLGGQLRLGADWQYTSALDISFEAGYNVILPIIDHSTNYFSLGVSFFYHPIHKSHE